MKILQIILLFILTMLLVTAALLGANYAVIGLARLLEWAGY